MYETKISVIIVNYNVKYVFIQFRLLLPDSMLRFLLWTIIRRMVLSIISVPGFRK